MADEPYHKLAKVLDTLPNGFPSSESGIEIKLLKRIFRPEDIELFCSLRLEFETAEQVAERTGYPLEGLDAHLTDMWRRGQIMGANVGGITLFRMVPWAFGIYEFQLPHMDREMAHMCEEYMNSFRSQFFKSQPQLMQVVPVEKEISGRQEALAYEQVSHIIENSRSFMVFDCICKKEKRLLGKGCDKPRRSARPTHRAGCLRRQPLWATHHQEGGLRRPEHGRGGRAGAPDLERANRTLLHLQLLRVLLRVLKNISQSGMPAGEVINSYYYAEIDPDLCVACGTCREVRCQVGAIQAGEDAYRVVHEKCIGCGLCVATCPCDAVRLIHKPPTEVIPPPNNEADWYEQRARGRGVDYSAFK